MSTTDLPHTIQGGYPIWENGHRIKEHLTRKDTVWGTGRVHLYQPGRAANELMPPLSGEEFLEYAKRGDHLISATVIEYLRCYPDQLFEDWKKPADGKFRKLYAFGTIFTLCGGSDGVKGLLWDYEDHKVQVFYTPLSARFFANSFAISPHSF